MSPKKNVALTPTRLSGRPSLTLFSLMLCIGFAGCASQTESRAIEQANTAARAEGYDLRRYQANARYNLSGDGVWTVFYEPKPDARGRVALGDAFTVYLNRTGTAESFREGNHALL